MPLHPVPTRAPTRLTLTFRLRTGYETKFGCFGQWLPVNPVFVCAPNDYVARRPPNFAAFCGWPQFLVLTRTPPHHPATAAAPGRCTCSWAAIAVCATVDRRGARPHPSDTR